MSKFDYLKEKRRMLNSLGRTGDLCERVACASCPLSVFNNKTGFQCNAFEMECPDKATAMVKKWAEEHPPKTLKQKFLEAFPNAQVSDEGYPIICVAVLDDNIECGSDYNCKECWGKEAKNNG